MRPQTQVEEVLQLLAAGFNDCEIARRTGIPRRTILDWRHGRCSLVRPGENTCGLAHDPDALPSGDYAYLLGMYLGDGCISATRGVWRLRIVLDSRYPGIVSECARAMEAVVPGKRAHILFRRDGQCLQVSTWWMHWPCLLPQHGPGLKHRRPIELRYWQQAIVAEQNEAFLRGLIHSDGCRFIARQRNGESEWSWTRYAFSNRSEDIQDLFCASCDALGVQWTRTAREVAVARRESVAQLDAFIGEKR